MRRQLTLGVLIAVGLLITSCLSVIFNQPPKPVVAIAEGSPYGPAPLTVVFDISGSFDPNGEIVSFTFDFGDGGETVEGTDLSEPIEHTYDEPGSYFAKLSVTDDRGTSASIKIAIMVYEPGA
jgi:PKD repeat protein